MNTLLIALSVIGQAAADRLLVASYGNETHAGAIQTLEVLPSTSANSSHAMKVTQENHECGTLPTWLDASLGLDRIVCLDESAANASLTMLSLGDDGNLQKVSNTSVLGGAVSSASYNNKSALALAHAPEQIHQAVVDPTGQYMIFPSLGADTVHVYCIDPVSHLLTEHAPLKSKQGYGPRHAVFWTSSNSTKTYLFVVHEKSNKITSYEVCYLEQGGLAFTEVDEVSTYGNQTVPPATFASEMTLSPDNRFLIAANRNGTVFKVENSDPTNSTQVPSDSLVTFKPSADGKLSFVQLAKSGGWYPRHFSMNQNGSLIAVANQLSKNVDIYARNLETGIIEDGKAVARANNLGPGDLM
ncbi:hypothetical protein AA0113_g3461 [Alternaria arborescens]|uniref:6-phosphogluconolactonase n=1 Tax=Alternaria arborescens TaxID=156630 RepID=A0A4Q4SJB5_9PLEO|nr:hypothetical protein AA0111_g6962 [Alternaria arborescens]RYN31460.1 hypothetical protein AA0112_g6414 [Alternaria arborescens]RYO28213.1 hypothetical protein AA0111_g6962 [Alternaria arborescens]RYO70189.1 hypothetical protein AA0113_g3461 [Alternaria arborescens]